jgi:dGTPase
MDVRQRTEEIERLTLASWATFSDASRGRVRPEEQDPIRPVFQRDRDRIIHCKAFRRLKQKTQVFLSPEGDLYPTRWRWRRSPAPLPVPCASTRI